MNSVNKILSIVGGIDGTIHEVAGPRLVDEGQKLNVCETGEWKVTLGYKLPAKYVFHTVRLRVKNKYKLNDFYKSFSENFLGFNVKSIAFCCGTIGFLGLIHGKLLKWHYPFLLDSY